MSSSSHRLSPCRLRRTLVPLVLALLQILSACTYGSDAGPRAAAPEDLKIIHLAPLPGAHHVPINPMIDVVFSAPLGTEAVDIGALRLFSGGVETQGHLHVDLLERRLRLIPDVSLVPMLRYRVYVRAHLRGLDGSRSLAEPTIFDFTTGSESQAPPAPRPSVNDAEVQPLWRERCVTCHNEARPTAGIDLASIARVRASLFNQPSPIASVSLIRPGDHARSYLLRKLLDAGGITGAPMPPAGPRLDTPTLRLVADWIDGMTP
ncbi:MAG: hypothetical protein KAI47_15850 [Deltaproteobacteria bacterium]|nr:hypothetical protein [Deltaproteobacteria bacterium]